LIAGNYVVSPGNSGVVFATSDKGLNVTLTNQTFAGGVTLTTGRAANKVDVTASRANEVLTLDTIRGRHDVVDIGDGNTANIKGTINVANEAPGGFTDLTVDNSKGTNASGNVTISGTSITGLAGTSAAAAIIEYADQSVGDLTIFGGSTSANYYVTGGPGGSKLQLATASDNNTFILSNNGLVNNISFPGVVVLKSGGSNNTLNINDSQDALSQTLTVNNSSMSGLTFQPIQELGFATLSLGLGTGANTLSVNTAGLGRQQALGVTAAGNLQLTQALVQGNLTVTDKGAVTVGVTGNGTAVSTQGGNVSMDAPSITVNQIINTTPGTKGMVTTGTGVKPQSPNALYVAGSGNIFLNANSQATTITVSAGSGQSAGVGTAFAKQLQALVTNGSGPVDGAIVTFTAPGGGASGTFANGTGIDIEKTDASGIATATIFTANGTVGGPYTVAATTDNAKDPANFSLTNTVGAASQLVFTSQPQTGIAGAPLGTITVQLADKFGNAVSQSGIHVTMGFGINPGGATLGGTTNVDTNGSGQAIFTNLTVSAGGVGYTLRALSFPLTSGNSVEFDQASQLVFVQQPSNTVAGQVIKPPITVQVEDQFGDKIQSPSFSIAMAIGTNPSGGVLSGTTPVTTDATGLATFSDLSINNAGNGYTLVATTGSLSVTSAPFDETGVATHLVFVQQPTSGTVGAVINPPITVQVEDASDAPVGGTFSITMAVNSGPGNLGGTVTRTTNSNGLATFDDLTLSTPGSYTLIASSNGLASTGPSNPFNEAAQLVFVQQPTNSTVGQPISPPVTVEAEDAVGNPLTGLSIYMAAAGGGGGTLSGTIPQTTDGKGIATFSDLSINIAGQGYTLVATVNNNSNFGTVISSSFDEATAATKLAFVQQPTSGTAGLVITPPITVQVEDSSGDPVSGIFGVSIGITPGTGTPGAVLGGTLSVTTDGNGLATFKDLTVSLAGTGYTLTAASGGLTSATSTAFDQTQTHLVFIQQPTNGNINTAISPPVTVEAEDQNDNPISGVSITMAISNNPGGATLSGGGAQTTDANGIATFSNLMLDKPGLGYTLVATAAAPFQSSVISQAFDQAGAATQLAFIQGPTTGNAGAIISPPVTVQVEDAQGDPVFGSFSITMGLGTNPTGATLGGTLMQATNLSGLATFSDLTLNLVGTGYTLKASSNGLTAANSASFDQLGVPTSLVFVQQPTSGNVGAVIAPPVTVDMLDQFGHPLAGSFSISMAIGNNPGGATLGGTTTQLTDDSGMATFNDLTIDQPGNGYTLIASSSGVPDVTSASFNEVVPQVHVFAVGADAGGTSMVKVYDSSSTLLASFLAFDPSFTGGVRVAIGDVNGDGIPDVIAASGPGQDPQVKVIDGTKLDQIGPNGEILDSALLAKFDAYTPFFLGGVNVAFAAGAGGLPELVTGAGPGGGPHVLVIDGTKLNQVLPDGQIAPSAILASFYAYNPMFPGGVSVAAGDVNGDGVGDIITAAGPGGGPHVLVIDGTKLNQLGPTSEPLPSALLGSFYAYAPAFTGGVSVAFGLGANGLPEVITGALAGGGPHAKVIDGTKLNDLLPGGEIASSSLLGSFYAYAPAFVGGVRVAATDINGDGVADVFLLPGPGTSQTLKIVDGSQLNNVQPDGQIDDSALLDSFYTFGSSYTDGIYVGAA
jgi:hypothetical protein